MKYIRFAHKGLRKHDPSLRVPAPKPRACTLFQSMETLWEADAEVSLISFPDSGALKAYVCRVLRLQR